MDDLSLLEGREATHRNKSGKNNEYGDDDYSSQK